MEIIIHHNNFKSSEALDHFIQEKSSQLTHINANIIKVEYHLSVIRDEFKCNLHVSVRGKDIHTHRTTGDMHFSILKVIDAAKKILQKNKIVAINSRQKKTKLTK